MNVWVLTLCALVLSLIIAVVGWINAIYKKREESVKTDMIFADSLKAHEKNFVNVDNRFEKQDLKIALHADFLQKNELKMGEFTLIQRDMVAMKTDFKDVCKRMEEAETRRDIADEKINDKFDEIKEALHRFELILAKNYKG